MKLHSLIVIAMAASSLTACSGGSSGGKAANSNVVSANPTDIKNHKVDECPVINGQYSLVNGTDESTKSIKTTIVQNGINLNDSNVNWIINSQSNAASEGPGFNYIGICSKGSIIIGLFEGTTFIGNLIYTPDIAQNKLVIESVVKDPRLGESGKETWDLKSN